MGSNELRSIGGSFNGRLFLGVPVEGHHVHEVQDASDRMACELVMIEWPVSSS
jgi:hypothetical protein